MDTRKYLTQIMTILFQAAAGSKVLVNIVTRYSTEDGAVVTLHNPKGIPQVVSIFRSAAKLYNMKTVNMRCMDCFGVGDLHGSVRFVSTPRPQDTEGFYDVRYEWTIGQAVIGTEEIEQLKGRDDISRT